MSSFDLPRRLAAEALGTCALVCTVIGSGIMADRLTDDVAVSLLGNTLPTGAILVVLITVFGPISGATLTLPFHSDLLCGVTCHGANWHLMYWHR